MANIHEKSLAQAASNEKESVAYLDCIFHHRYAEHLPFNILLQDMTQLRNRNVLGYIGAMSFCQRAFVQARTHLYKIYNEEISIRPKDYRHALTSMAEYIQNRSLTNLADLYAFCSTSHPHLIKGELGSGLTVFRRFLDEHPTIFETAEPSPRALEKLEITSHAIVHSGVLLFPKIKIAVGRVVNVSGNMAYLECQGEFISFHAVSANLPASSHLKNYITKGDMVPFEARYYVDQSISNGSGSPPVALASSYIGSNFHKFRNVWKAVNVELPRNASSPRQTSSTTIVTTATVESSMSSPRSPQKSPFESPARRLGNSSDHRPSTTTTISTNSYMAPLDDATEWAPVNSPDRRRASTMQKRDSSVSTTGTNSVTAVKRTGSMNYPAGDRSLSPNMSTLSKYFNPFQIDKSTQAGSGRSNQDKEVQTDVTDEELMLRLIRKYPNVLENMKF